MTRDVSVREESDPVGRDPDVGHGYEMGDTPMPPALPEWRAYPSPRPGWWTLAKTPALLFLLLLPACSGNPTPQPPQFPATDPGEPTIIWRGRDQVELSWSGMPVLVRGGSEDSVLRLSAAMEMHEPRAVALVESFMGFDRGDAVEADVQVYGDGNAVIYRRSLHLEGDVPDCYDAYARATSETSQPTAGLVVHATCRVNGANGNPEHPRFGDLSARCHFLVTVTFEGDSDA